MEKRNALPTENEWWLHLGISRVTVGQALGAAVDEHLLVRVAGRGTYVAEKASVASQKFVGYVVPTLSHSFNIQPLLGVESVIKQKGYHLIFSTSEGSLEKENQALKVLDFQGVVGFIVSPVYVKPPTAISGSWWIMDDRWCRSTAVWIASRQTWYP